MTKPEICPACGSTNTSAVRRLAIGPSLLTFVFFGIWYLLARTALAVSKRSCQDCGFIYNYRGKSAYIAIGLLALLILAVLLVSWGDGE